MSRAQLIEMARTSMKHAEDGTAPQADSILEIPAEHYFDEARWEQEMRQVFKRMPLMVALTCEMPNPQDYRAMEVAGLPILLIRGDDGEVRAFVNSCRHRGAQILMEGNGSTHRLTCPYHAWTYNLDGALTGVFAHKDFGEFDKDCYSLTPLPVLERSGLIWVVPNPKGNIDINAFLSGYDAMLAHFGFDNWHLFERRTVKGPNWKIAYDGYLDLYHLPILHKDTFGSNFPHRTIYTAWGPHQRVSSPDPSLLELDADHPETWDTDRLMTGVWTIFPHVSIAGFEGGGRSVMISQLFPGATPQESFTVQNYVMENEPTEAQAQEAKEQFKFLEYVVQEEDYATGLRQQQALMSGHMSHVLFGKNEGGGQVFHGWVDKLLNTDDEHLNELFGEVSAG